jgi:vancomycin resistance protein YoaR
VQIQRSLLGFFGILGLFGFLGFFPPKAEAALPTLTYRYKHLIYTIAPLSMTQWQGQTEAWTFNGQPVEAPAELRVDGDAVPPLPVGFARSLVPSWDASAIAATIRDRVSSQFDRTAGSVTISRNASGSIVFDGIGFPGRAIDTAAAARLTVQALKNGVTDITLPVTETQPAVTVNDPELKAQGITELVTMGESDFHGSTKNRIHNVTTGLNKFNGHLIAKDEIFSFDKVLGRVDASTGYLKELTIIGDKTLPDYGGGLCQVSSTAYRGVWEYGFPIMQRKNHSFAVHYYAPQGTDATVYPPNVDIKFKNDSPGALLMQTAIDVPNTKAYFLYYGTKDDRKADVIGPFSWGYTPAPPPRTEETTEIAPGTRRKVGEAVPGLHAAWFRVVQKNGAESVQSTYSTYEARPLYWQIGVEKLSTSGSLTTGGGSEAVISD